MGMDFFDLHRDHRLGQDIGESRDRLLARCRAMMADPTITALARPKFRY
jgi:hypothetical protein